MEVVAMKPPADSSQIKGDFSELAGLSRDPALTFKADPSFQAKFRNPDEHHPYTAPVASVGGFAMQLGNRFRTTLVTLAVNCQKRQLATLASCLRLRNMV
jgi:hypothetical protein